jgi:leucyl aminopeptidase
MRFSLSVSAILTAVLLASVNAAPAPALSEFAAKSAKGLRLLSIEDGMAPVWKTEDEKLELMRASVQFVR